MSVTRSYSAELQRRSVRTDRQFDVTLTEAVFDDEDGMRTVLIYRSASDWLMASVR